MGVQVAMSMPVVPEALGEIVLIEWNFVSDASLDPFSGLAIDNVGVERQLSASPHRLKSLHKSVEPRRLYREGSSFFSGSYRPGAEELPREGVVGHGGAVDACFAAEDMVNSGGVERHVVDWPGGEANRARDFQVVVDRLVRGGESEGEVECQLF